MGQCVAMSFDIEYKICLQNLKKIVHVFKTRQLLLRNSLRSSYSKKKFNVLYLIRYQSLSDLIVYNLKKNEKRDYCTVSCFDAHTMNDPYEGKVLHDIAKNKNFDEFARMVESARNKRNRHYVYFIHSLSKKNDVLDMWRSYTSNQKKDGIAITFPITQKSLYLDKLYEINYDYKQQKNFVAHVNKLMKNAKALLNSDAYDDFLEDAYKIVEEIFYICKNPEHEYEEEVRLLIKEQIDNSSIEVLELHENHKYRLYMNVKCFYFDHPKQTTITINPFRQYTEEDTSHKNTKQYLKFKLLQHDLADVTIKYSQHKVFS
jgi:hypothetical protein